MEETLFNNIVAEIKKVEKENNKLKDLKKRYIQHGEVLRVLINDMSNAHAEFIKRLQYIAKSIDPVPFSNSTKTTKLSSEKVNDILYEIIEKMKAGQHITFAFLQSAYNDLNENNLRNIFKRIMKMPNINKAKDGKIIRLYHKDA